MVNTELMSHASLQVSIFFLWAHRCDPLERSGEGFQYIIASLDSDPVVDSSSSGRREKIEGIIELTVQRSQGGAFLMEASDSPPLPLEPGIFGQQLIDNSLF
jgi:hypothetical protein